MAIAIEILLTNTYSKNDYFSHQLSKFVNISDATKTRVSKWTSLNFYDPVTFEYVNIEAKIAGNYSFILPITISSLYYEYQVKNIEIIKCIFYIQK